MDKLKQVQKYQFWILLSVALILPLVGWSMTVSSLAKDAEEKTKAINDLNKSLTTSPPDPNQEWKKGIEIINGEQGKQKLLAWRYLWDRQAPLMTWPEKMPSDPEKIQPGHQEYWRTAYRKLVTQVRLKVNPYDDDHPNGLVEYPEDLLPNPDEEWVVQAPSIKQIVASQEDLWLLESLLTAIGSVNTGAPSVYDAPIRQIDQLYLRGGTPKGTGGAKPAGGSSAGAGGVGEKGMGMMMDLGKSSGPGRDLGGGGGSAIAPSEINADDDLGAERVATAAKAPGGDKSGAASGAKTGMPMGMVMPMGGDSSKSSGAGFGSAKGSWSSSDKDRYRDEKLEWRTRGFHLEVTMHHRRVPELLAALANATWPITVLRIQMSDIVSEDLADVGGGMPGMSGMPGGAGSGRAGGMSPSMMANPMRAMGAGALGGKSAGGMARSGGAARGSDDASDSMNNRSALDDPNLAHVAIVGLIYIVKQPPEDKTPAPPPTPAGAPTGAPGGASPVAAAPAGAPTAAVAGETADSTTSAAAAEAPPEGDKPTDEPADAESQTPEGDKPSEGAQTSPLDDSKKPAPAAPGKS